MRRRRASSRASPSDSKMFFPCTWTLLEWTTFQSGSCRISLGTFVKPGSPAPAFTDFSKLAMSSKPRDPPKPTGPPGCGLMGHSFGPSL
eukprot:812715-Pyramimonas_sp.AAC.1